MSKPLWPFRVKCKHQEWSGEDVPFCECKLFRGNIVKKKDYYYYQSIKACWYSYCPRKKKVKRIT